MNAGAVSPGRLLVVGQCLARDVPARISAAVSAARMIERIKNAPREGGETESGAPGRCNALKKV